MFSFGSDRSSLQIFQPHLLLLGSQRPWVGIKQSALVAEAWFEHCASCPGCGQMPMPAAIAHVVVSRTARVWAKCWKPSLRATATDGRLACSVRYCTTRPPASPSAVIALTTAVP
jgi:hypothetical protein